MADSTSSTVDPTALAQLLTLLQKNQQTGNPPTAPNQVTNNQGMAFQLGANNTPTPENPGSSPEFSAPGTLTSLPTSGMSDQALQNWYNSNQGNTFYNSQGQLAGIPSESGGGANQGNSYGMAAPSQGGTPEPGTIRAMMNKGGILNGASLSDPQSDQFNQLVQGLLKQYQSQPPTAPSAAQPVLPPPAPTVPNNQVAYTDPSKAVIPGMGTPPVPAPGSMPPVAPPAPLSTLPAMTTNSADLQAKAATGQMTPQTVPPTMAPALADKLQQGTIQPSDITGAGGPLQASTGSGISPGSLPPQAATTAVSQPTPSRSYSSNPFSQTSPTAASPSTQITLPSNTPGASGMIGNIPGVTVAQVPTGNVTPVTGATGQVAMPSDIDGTSGYVANVPGVTGSQAAATANTPTGGGMTPQMGNAIASGIGQIGSAIQGAYKPIALRPIPSLQQPKSPVFGIPTMSQ